MDERATDGTRRSRRSVLRGIAGAAVASGLAGCSADALPTRDLPGSYAHDVLRFGQVLPPISLDPVEVDDPWSKQVLRRIFQSLYAYDRELNLVPVLADGEPDTNADGTRYTVGLREEPSFQDGSDVSPADVKYSFEAPRREETPNRWKVDMIEEVATPDETTVEFVLEYPYPNFEHSLTQPIVPKTAREENAVRFGREFAPGSGPYEVQVFKRGKYAVLERWSEYWGPAKPAVNWLKFVNVHSGLARTMSLKTGQNDVVERVQPKFWDATADFPDANVVRSPGYTSYYLGFNTTVEPTESARVREAIDYLVSMDEFVEEVVGEDGRRQYGPVPPQVAREWGMPVEEWRAIPHRRNPERARAILNEEFGKMRVSGWSPKVVAPHDDYLAQKLAQKISHQLKTIGFRRARTKTHHWREFQDVVTSADQEEYAMFVTSRAGNADPDSFLYPMVHENMQGLTNGTYYNYEPVMERIEAARQTAERGKRKAHYEAAISTLLEDRAIVPAFTLDNSFGVKRHVSGFEPHPMAGYNPVMLSPEGEPSLDQNRGE